MGETEIEVPRDRQASFDSIILPKHKRDVFDYARGMSQRDISATIDDICGFKLSAELPKSQTKIGKIGGLRRSIRSFSSIACLC